MQLMHKQYIGYSILLLGLISFCYYINAFEFTSASITMLSSVLLWVAFSVYFDNFDKAFFSKILCISGLLLSVSIFFMFGIEEVPFPEGALVFHSDGIALTMLALLISILPILFLSDIQPLSDLSNTQHSEAQSNITQTRSDEGDIDDWEVATDIDLESGDFEVAA